MARKQVKPAPAAERTQPRPYREVLAERRARAAAPAPAQEADNQGPVSPADEE